MLRLTYKKRLPLMMLAIATIIATSAGSVAAEDTKLDKELNSIKGTPPFTQAYIKNIDSLHEQLLLAKKTDQLYDEAQGFLSGATLRVKFMLEELVNRLAPVQAIDIYNYDYVKSTLDDVAVVLDKPAFKNRTLKNKQVYQAMLTRIASLEKQKDALAIVEDTLAALTEQSTVGQINDAIATYLKLKGDTDLLSEKNTAHFAKIIAATGVTAVTLPVQVLAAENLNIYSQEMLEEKIDVKYEEIAAKKMVSDYHIGQAFKLTVNGNGGKIPLTTFTVKAKGDNLFVINSAGEVFGDLDLDPETVTFKSGNLGDFYVGTRAAFKEYSTDFSSMQEYQYQCYVVGMLENDLYNTSGDLLYFNSVGMDMLPTKLLSDIANANKTIVIEDKSVVYFPPATFKKLDPKAAQSPVAMLYKSGDKTLVTELPEKDKEADMVSPVITEEFKTPNKRIITLLANLGGVLTAIAIFGIFRAKDE